MLNYLHNYCVTIIGGGFFAFRPFPYSPLGLVAAAGGRLRRRGHGHRRMGQGAMLLYVLALPLELAGRGLRALSLLGGFWNILAWGLYGLLCLLPALLGLLAHGRGKGQGHWWMGIPLSLCLFYFLYRFINPALLGRLDGGRPALPGCQPGQAPFQPGLLERRGRLVWPVAAQAYGTAGGIGRAIPGVGAGGDIPHGGIVLCAGV